MWISLNIKENESLSTVLKVVLVLFFVLCTVTLSTPHLFLFRFRNLKNTFTIRNRVVGYFPKISHQKNKNFHTVLRRTLVGIVLTFILVSAQIFKSAMDYTCTKSYRFFFLFRCCVWNQLRYPKLESCYIFLSS